MNIVKERYESAKKLGTTSGMMQNDWYYTDELIEYKGGYQVWRTAINRDEEIVIDDDVSDQYGGTI